MDYIIESRFSIGDVVSPKLDPDERYYVIGFIMYGSDEAGNVTNYLIECSSKQGSIIKMYEFELELVTELKE